MFDVCDSAKPMREVMPSGVRWVKDKVTTFHPDNNQVIYLLN